MDRGDFYISPYVTLSGAQLKVILDLTDEHLVYSVIPDSGLDVAVIYRPRNEEIDHKFYITKLDEHGQQVNQCNDHDGSTWTMYLMAFMER